MALGFEKVVSNRCNMPVDRHFSRQRHKYLHNKNSSKKREIPFALQLLGAIGGIITGALSIYIGFVSVNLQEQSNKLASNDTLQREQIHTLTGAVNELKSLNKQSLELNTQVVELVEEARNQSNISLFSNEPQIGIIKPVVSYLKTIFNGDSSQFSDAATFNQTIVFKNYGRREAIPIAIYIYLFEIDRSDPESYSPKNKDSSISFSTIAKASTGAIDPTINYQEIPPGDTLGYSFSTFIMGYWNAEDWRNGYEVIKFIYQDPLGRQKEKKFYFQYDSDSSVNFAIPKVIRDILDKLTKLAAPTGKGIHEPFVGTIRPNR